MSPRPGSSTLITSAPSQARSWVQDGPDWTWVMSRTRMPSRAFSISSPRRRLREFAQGRARRRRRRSRRAPPLLVHRLGHRPRRVDVGIDPDVDERRHAGPDRLAAALERRADLPRIAHLLAVPAEHLGELRERHVAKLVADLAAL